jgi:hypothetical protein
MDVSDLTSLLHVLCVPLKGVLKRIFALKEFFQVDTFER